MNLSWRFHVRKLFTPEGTPETRRNTKDMEGLARYQVWVVYEFARNVRARAHRHSYLHDRNLFQFLEVERKKKARYY